MLCYASEAGHNEIVQLLIRNKAILDANKNVNDFNHVPYIAGFISGWKFVLLLMYVTNNFWYIHWHSVH